MYCGYYRSSGMQAPDLCQDIEECARCVKKLQSDDTDCQELINQGCNATLYTGNTDPGKTTMATLLGHYGSS